LNFHIVRRAFCCQLRHAQRHSLGCVLFSRPHRLSANFTSLKDDPNPNTCIESMFGGWLPQRRSTHTESWQEIPIAARAQLHLEDLSLMHPPSTYKQTWQNTLSCIPRLPLFRKERLPFLSPSRRKLSPQRPVVQNKFLDSTRICHGFLGQYV